MKIRVLMRGNTIRGLTIGDVFIGRSLLPIGFTVAMWSTPALLRSVSVLATYSKLKAEHFQAEGLKGSCRAWRNLADSLAELCSEKV